MKFNLKGQTYCPSQQHIVICDGLCDNCPVSINKNSVGGK